MYVALMILVGLALIISFLQFLLNRKWTLIYTAIGYENYFGVIGKLKKAGVKYKSKTPMNFRVDARFKDNTQYDIYVKKEDEHFANKALQAANQ
ncbi:hypothetical protein [Neobacillus soli]|uniref:hypothetical protein n=1 Tax=Neobacillus soli TaxID=220688 RepID=UPI0008243DBE|nr:hypothetical protein [Neobacillus soli]